MFELEQFGLELDGLKKSLYDLRDSLIHDRHEEYDRGA